MGSVANSEEDPFEVISSEDLLHHTKVHNRRVKEIQEKIRQEKLKKENCKKCNARCKKCEEEDTDKTDNTEEMVEKDVNESIDKNKKEGCP